MAWLNGQGSEGEQLEYWEKQIWGRVMWRDLCKWALSVKMFVLHVHASQWMVNWLWRGFREEYFGSSELCTGPPLSNLLEDGQTQMSWLGRAWCPAPPGLTSVENRPSHPLVSHLHQAEMLAKSEGKVSWEIEKEGYEYPLQPCDQPQ